MDILPSLYSELRKLLYLILRALPLGLLFLIPPINLAAPFLWALFSAWMLAIEYSTTAGKSWLHFPHGKCCASDACWRTGLAAAAAHADPPMNFIAMPAAVAGATALWVGGVPAGTYYRKAAA
jgi:CysZ protein